VRSPESVETLMTGIRKQFGRIDILINNAGVAHALANVDELSIEAWREVIDTNLTGVFLVTRAALRLMDSGATIINNLSISAKVVFPGMSAYNASKHGALGFTDTLREELRSRGIRVIGLLPGATDTEIWEQFWPEAPREKMMSAESVAAAVIAALKLPANATVSQIEITPTGGAL
jgi:NAD(P)-dependent dehydrogenase (short-subunit alcohol dehydrogenase family)